MRFTLPRLLVGLLLLLVLAAFGGWWHIGSAFSGPAHRTIGPAPDDLGAQDVSFGGGIKGWLVPAGGSSPCVVLMHGMGGDRRNMVDRARLFKGQGYTVLLFDFQAHGESPGDHITFGFREADNARAAVDFIKANASCTRTVALGVSMGGAAALLGPQPLPVDALVLESVYPTIEEATRDRMVDRFGPLGQYLTPLLLPQLPLRLNIPVEALHPIDHIGELRCPVLIMAGDSDPLTPPAETLRLFSQAPGPKSYWLAPGVGHSDLFDATGGAYRRHLLGFLAATARSST